MHYPLTLIASLLCTSVSLDGHESVETVSSTTGKFLENQCGPACLYLASKRLGQEKSFEYISDKCHGSVHGTTLGELEEAARECGWYPVVAEVSSAELATIFEPAIIHVPSNKKSRGGHFILFWGDGEHIQVLDPSGFSFRPAVDHLPLAALIVCPDWFSSVSCRYWLLFLRSPWRAIVAGILGVLALALSIVLLKRILAKTGRWLRASRIGKLFANLVPIVCICLVAPACRNKAEPEKAGKAKDRTPVGKLVCTERVADARFQRLGDSISHIFTFKNQSSEIVTIRRVQTSCLCLSADLLTPKTVAPGEEGQLKVTASADVPGGRVTNVSLVGEKREELVSFEMRLRVPYRWCFDSPAIALGDIYQPSIGRTVRRVYLDEKTSPALAAKTLRVSKPCPGIDVEVVGPGELSSGVNTLLVRLQTRPGIALKTTRNAELEMTVADSDGTDHRIPLQLSWTFDPSLACRPPELVLIASKGKVIGASEIAIKLPAFQLLTRARAESELLSADVSEVKGSPDYRNYRSQVRYLGKGKEARSVQGFINYYAGEDSAPVLRLAFKLRVEP